MDSIDTDGRSRLSWMWVFVMLNMIYADIFSFMNAGVLQGFLEGRAEEIVITPTFLLVAAIVTEIPIAMAVLSHALPQRANRWANMIVSIFTIAYIWGGGLLSMPHYVFIAGIETVVLVYIARFAWKWRAADERVLARNLATE